MITKIIKPVYLTFTTTSHEFFFKKRKQLQYSVFRIVFLLVFRLKIDFKNSLKFITAEIQNVTASKTLITAAKPCSYVSVYKVRAEVDED